MRCRIGRYPFQAKFAVGYSMRRAVVQTFRYRVPAGIDRAARRLGRKVDSRFYGIRNIKGLKAAASAP